MEGGSRAGLRESAAAIVATKLWTTFVRRMVVMARDVRTPWPPVAPPFGARFDLLRPEGLADLYALRPELRFDDLRARLASGDRCCAGRLGDRLVHAMWVARGTGPLPYLGGELILDPGDLYVYDSFTPPSLRGRDLSSACHLFVFERARAEGFHRVLGAVAVENRAGRRVLDKVGYQPIGTYRSVRLGSLGRIEARALGAAPVPALVRRGRAAGI
ncbi:MAG TPA: hypothetical protein VFD92_10525 [Candidatus Binatia bacterium]|nr:hypothetical protein [Candidatus Binatia bacterium]